MMWYREPNACPVARGPSADVGPPGVPGGIVGAPGAIVTAGPGCGARVRPSIVAPSPVIAVSPPVNACVSAVWQLEQRLEVEVFPPQRGHCIWTSAQFLESSHHTTRKVQA